MRFAIYLLAFTAVAFGLAYALFVQNGIDPLASEVRTILLLTIVAAAYVGLRLTMVLRGFEQRQAERDGTGDRLGGGGGKRSAFSRWGRSSALDARLEARRERLRRAQQADGEGSDAGSPET